MSGSRTKREDQGLLARARVARGRRQLGDLDFVNSIVLFGASLLLLSVLPFIILLSSLANRRIDTDLSRHIGLNDQGARIVNQLFRSTLAHAAAPACPGR